MSVEIELLKRLGVRVKESASGKLELFFYHIDTSDDSLKAINSIDNIEALVFYCTNITDDELKLIRLESLKKLGLNSCRSISDEAISHIAKLKGLESLSLVDTSITSEGKARLKGMLPNLTLY